MSSEKDDDANYLKGISSFRVPRADTAVAIESFYSSLDCPRSLGLWLLFKNGDHDQVAAATIDPLCYNDPEDFRTAYIATKFLSKYKAFKTTLDLDEIAMTKFLQFEELCAETNSRFRYPLSDPKKTDLTVWLHHAVRQKIERILGEFDEEQFFDFADWGPGASTLIKRKHASSPAKFQYETGITRDLYSLLPIDLLAGVYPAWASQLKAEGYPKYYIGNRVVTVPKDSTTNRVIAIEPGVNLWFQKALGRQIEQKLRKCGIDLRYQSRNQKLCKEGSISSKLATVDVSSASDSLSFAVVEDLLPPKWFSMLNLARSHYGTVRSDTKPIKWEKFSSMGNGFTFQLETLIFYAISSCCVEYVGSDTKVSVYGDDIVVPVECEQPFLVMMDYFGFIVNRRKSHFSSYFRESCGSHFFKGICCKPVFLKEPLLSFLQIVKFYNAVRLLSHRSMSYLACDSRFKRLCNFLIRLVPSALRLRIPSGLGDVGFIGNFDESTPQSLFNTENQLYWEGFQVRTVAESGDYIFRNFQGILLGALWLQQKRSLQIGVSRREQISYSLKPSLAFAGEFGVAGFEDVIPTGNKMPFGGTNLLVLRSVVVSQWYELGPWI